MPAAPALLVNGYVKSKLVPFRFERDHSATPTSFKARAQFFDLIEEKRLDRLEQPHLVSSLHGAIERILFTIPYWVFHPEMYPAEEQMIRKYAAVFRHILSTLPQATRVVLFTHQRSAALAREWLEELGMAGRTEIVEAPDTMRFSVWAEDAYCVCEDLIDDESYLVEPASFTRMEDAYIADRIAPATDLQTTQVPLYFQGGNLLIGDDFWFIGADYPANSLELNLIVPKPGESKADAVARGYGSLVEHERQLIVVGARVPVPAMHRRPVTINDEAWHEVLYFGNQEGTLQPLFHIDMFISLVGRNAAGAYTVLVGSPQLAFDMLDEAPHEAAMQDVFDDIASGLAALGFDVVRNPLPLVYDDDDQEKLRYWYFATGNNVIAQDNPRKVWIPTYGHAPWDKLAVIDAENKRTWESLGYTVELLPDFHPFAANLGAAHCIKKYLGRA